jgi:iron complex outermembrane receptor protein
MDADAFHIHFINQYTSFTPTSGPDNGFTYYYATPPSNTNGIESEGNIVVARGLSLFLNGTYGRAKYEAAPASSITEGGVTQTIAATPSAWVPLAPHDTETIGTTYQNQGWDAGFFNKRVGTRWEVDGAGNPQTVPLDPWWMSNLFLNYTIRNGSHFDESKLKFSVNNLFNNHNIADIGAANASSGYGVLYTPSSLDTLELLPSRSFMVSFQLGFSPKER